MYHLERICSWAYYSGFGVINGMVDITNCLESISFCTTEYLGGLVQERRNSIANAMELLLSCTDRPI